MFTFLCICLGLSASLMLLAYAMDANALDNDVRGANGLPMFVALYVSIAASLVVVVITLWAWGIGGAIGVAAFSALWHISAKCLMLRGLLNHGSGTRAKRQRNSHDHS